jgi:hypothetical protein
MFNHVGHYLMRGEVRTGQPPLMLRRLNVDLTRAASIANSLLWNTSGSLPHTPSILEHFGHGFRGNPYVKFKQSLVNVSQMPNAKR